jgi:beta-barrel assembly-enhancing protease
MWNSRAPRNNRRLAAVLAGLCCAGALTGGAAPAVSATSSLPTLGDSASEEMGVGAERRLGERIMREIRRDPDVIDDPLLAEYVRTMWLRLVASARGRGELSAEQAAHFAFETFLVRDRSINAFALPGGFVGVHLGLIAMTASEDELAAVLAHELSHVTQRHIARSLASSRRQTLLGTTALILGVLAASRSNSMEAANAAIVGGQAAMIQGQLNFSRDMEREADRVGYGVLDQAGFAAQGMSAMFDKLQQASRLNDSQQFPYLRSHPLNSERIGEARARLNAAPGTASGSVASPWSHAAMQGRARALMDPRAASLQRLAEALAGGSPAVVASPAGLSAVYAATLATIRLKEWGAAAQGLQRLKSALAAHPELASAVNHLSVELALEQGQGVEAQLLLAQREDNSSRHALFLAARAALVAGRGHQGVAEALQGWVVAQPADAGAWQWLAQLQARQGQELAALRSSAEAQWALGDLSGAVDRLRAALRQARTQRAESMDAAIISARLRLLEERLRRETLEERDGRNP